MNIDGYNIIFEKLNEFIRKYYKNLLIKGLLLSIGLLLAFFLILGLMEYYVYFDSSIRIFLFYSYIILGTLILVYFIVVPLLKLNKLGKTLNYHQCEKIISNHFSNIEDKLLNILELTNQLLLSDREAELLIASINQKTHLLRPYNFSLAIDFKKNRKYLRFVIIPVVLFLFIITTSPSMIIEPTDRLIHYNSIYEKPSPFQFIIKNKKLEAIQQDDFELEVKVVGEKIPEKVFIQIGNSVLPLEKKTKLEFRYLFKQIKNPVVFSLISGDYQTKEYILKVIKKPAIVSFDVHLDYPDYTGKEDENQKNNGDLIVPEGTRIVWKFKTQNALHLILNFNNSKTVVEHKFNDDFYFNGLFLKNCTYSIKCSNDQISPADSIIYNITIIQDQYPQIDVLEYTDSLFKYAYFFTGEIKDDYGFDKLDFCYKRSGTKDSMIKSERIMIPIKKGNPQEKFLYFFDFASLKIMPGEKIEYYFEIFDNDGINGSKSTKSRIGRIEIPSIEEISKIIDNKSNEIKDKLQDKISELRNIQLKLDKLNQKILQSEKIGWQERNELKNIIEQEKKIGSDIEMLKKENEEKNSFENEFKEPDLELLEKQEKLEELFNEIFNEETKKLFEELQKLLDSIDKNKIQDIIDKMKLTNKDLKDQLDRNLELFKEMEFENKLESIINQVDDLKQKQDSLMEKTLKSPKEKLPDIMKEQEELKLKFNNIEEDLKKLDTLNKNLENTKELINTEQMEEEIKNAMNNSEKDLQNKNKKNATESQKKASDKLEEMSNELSEMKENQEEEQYEEDINNLRQILENLIQVSFNQEDLIIRTQKINITDPKYLKIIQEQKKLSDDIKIVEDSLLALSKRQVQIEPIINMEINKITSSIEKSLRFMNERNLSNTLVNQQLAMTSVNNLALLLAEALNQMKEDNNQNKKSGKKGNSCKKPGGGKPDLKSIRQLQQQLNKEIQDLKEGNIPKPGNKGNNTMSEKLAKLAAQQQMLRNQLKEAQDNMKKEGGGIDAKEIKKISDMMEKTETDLVNKLLNKQLMERQKEIETRLLESEKSEIEKEYEKKRESNEAKNLYFSNKIQKKEYKRYMNSENEILKNNNPVYRFFYKKKVSEYFNNFNQ